MDKVTSLSDNCSDLLNSKEENDYSGKDFIDCKAIHKESVSFDHSFFKGCTFKSVEIHNSTFRHIEFDESYFSDNSTFINCDFKSSDLIYNYFDDVVFENCSFRNGEWRESVFKNVTFINCDFTSTTINLCQFEECSFDNTSAESFHGSSKTFNIFFKTEFKLYDINFLEYNFGIKGPTSISQKPKTNIINPFFELSLLYFSNQLTNSVFIDKIMDLLELFHNTKSRNFQAKIKFISNLVVNITSKQFSVVQMQYLYYELKRSVQYIENQLLLMEILKIVTSLGTEITKQVEYIKSSYKDLEFKTNDKYIIDLRFENSYTQEQMNNFVLSLCDYISISPSQVEILEYSQGSTIFKFAISGIFSLSIFLTSVNCFLPQLHITIEYSHKIYKEVKEFSKSIDKYNEKEAILKSLEKVDTKSIEKVLDTQNRDFLAIEGHVEATIA
jgi:hypothetical protein